MVARRRSPKAEKDLSERQRFWLKHLRAAERKGDALNAYAARLGLSESSLYEAKRRLRACGVIAPAGSRRVRPRTSCGSRWPSPPGRRRRFEFVSRAVRCSSGVRHRVETRSAS